MRRAAQAVSWVNFSQVNVVPPANGAAAARRWPRALLASGCADVIDILDDLGDHGHGPDEGPTCVPSRPGSAADADVVVDLDVEYQRIAGFGGINVPGWIPDLTAEQVDTAFGNGDGQLGMSILRVRVPYDPTQFELEVPAAARAVSHGATVTASPWSPPPALKTSADPIGGELLPEFYGAYADHLLSFRDFMAANGVPFAGDLRAERA